MQPRPKHALPYAILKPPLRLAKTSPFAGFSGIVLAFAAVTVPGEYGI